MNSRTTHLWLYILLMCAILSFEVIETDDGFVMRKFGEWRDRCRRKFEYFRIAYNIWRLFKNLPKNSLKTEDYDLLNHTFFEMIEPKEYLKLNNDRWKNQTFVRKMYDFCSRPMNNVTDLLKEMKKYKKSLSVYKKNATRKSSSTSRLKKVLDTCIESGYERGLRITVVPKTSLNPERSLIKKWNWMKFTAPNENGQPETVDIFLDHVPHANLSTLVRWLSAAEDMESNMQKLKETGDVEVIKRSLGIVNSNDLRDPMQLLECTLDFCEDLKKRVNQELRKPEKDWNYSKEEDHQLILSQ